MLHWLDKVLLILQAQTADLRELARLAGGDPKTFYRGVKLSQVDHVGQNIEGMEFSDEHPKEFDQSDPNDPAADRELVQQTFVKIRDTKRAEERLAVLLLAILQRRTIAEQLLGTLAEDRSKYATAALRDLRQLLNSAAPDESTDPIKLMQLVRRHYVHAFPDSRAALLFYMAKHLSVFPAAKEYLRGSWTKSYSYSFERYEKMMREYLK